MSTTLGRIPASQTIVLDDDSSQKGQAMLRKIDELNAAVKAIAAQLDGDSGVTDTTYASLNTDSLADLELTG